MNPAVVQIHNKRSTVCHACADRTFDIIRAANKDANSIIRPGQGPKTPMCRHCKLRRAIWWFDHEYGLDRTGRVVPLEVASDESEKDAT